MTEMQFIRWRLWRFNLFIGYLAMKMMKALVKSRPEKGLWMEEVPVPVPGPNDVLIKVSKTAICGTDLHIYKWDEWAQKTIHTPMVIGHEYVGVIAEMGSEVRGFHIGERVSGEGHIACGYCRNCLRGRKHICERSVGIGVNRDGAFAEYVLVPAENVIMMDSKISDDFAAIMDPLGNATHTALSFNVLGEDVIITGAGGPIGCMTIAICKFAGARNVVALETHPYRIGLARKMGATAVVNPMHDDLEEVKASLGITKGFDIGLECSGAPAAFNQMIEQMYNGGKISLLGILPSSTRVNWNDIIFKGLHLKGIYGREMFETWYKMRQMVLTGLNLAPVITHHFDVDDFMKGFEVMESGECGKVILDWK
jgi:threonine 3-dehydrogenase